MAILRLLKDSLHALYLDGGRHPLVYRIFGIFLLVLGAYMVYSSLRATRGMKPLARIFTVLSRVFSVVSFLFLGVILVLAEELAGDDLAVYGRRIYAELLVVGILYAALYAFLAYLAGDGTSEEEIEELTERGKSFLSGLAVAVLSALFLIFPKFPVGLREFGFSLFKLKLGAWIYTFYTAWGIHAAFELIASVLMLPAVFMNRGGVENLVEDVFDEAEARGDRRRVKKADKAAMKKAMAANQAASQKIDAPAGPAAQPAAAAKPASPNAAKPVASVSSVRPAAQPAAKPASAAKPAASSAVKSASSSVPVRPATQPAAKPAASVKPAASTPAKPSAPSAERTDSAKILEELVAVEKSLAAQPAAKSAAAAKPAAKPAPVGAAAQSPRAAERRTAYANANVAETVRLDHRQQAVMAAWEELKKPSHTDAERVAWLQARNEEMGIRNKVALLQCGVTVVISDKGRVSW